MITNRNKTIYSSGYDMTVYIEYNKNNQISGINFMMGYDVLCEYLNKPCPFLTELFHTTYGIFNNGNLTDEETIIQVCNLFTNLMIRDMDFKNKTFTKTEY